MPERRICPTCKKVVAHDATKEELAMEPAPICSPLRSPDCWKVVRTLNKAPRNL